MIYEVNHSIFGLLRYTLLDGQPFFFFPDVVGIMYCQSDPKKIKDCCDSTKHITEDIEVMSLADLMTVLSVTPMINNADIEHRRAVRVWVCNTVLPQVWGEVVKYRFHKEYEEFSDVIKIPKDAYDIMIYILQDHAQEGVSKHILKLLSLLD